MKVLYLWLIRFISIFNYFRGKKNVIYIMSFASNLRLIKQMASSIDNGGKLIVFYTPKMEAAAIDLAAYGIQTYQFHDGLHFVFKQLPIILTGQVVFCDNYFAFLGGMIHSKELRIVQLWHANGAIKKFGWEDPATSRRSNSDKRRFQNVYNQFNDYVVASKVMGEVFSNSYHVSINKMMYLGYPRSDRFFNSKWIESAKERVYRVAPELKGKRVILYAPTYRDENETTFNPPKNIAQALTADKNAVAIIKLHPLLADLEKEICKRATKSNLRLYPNLSTADLLTVTDTLVTDYSSVAFDYSLLPNAKNMFFFMYDLEAYKLKPGIQSNLLEWLPSKPILKLDDLKTAIINDKPIDFTKFNQKWNTYNDGHATTRVIKRYIDTLK